MAKFHISENAAALNLKFADFVVGLSKASIADHGFFAIGLSGGSSATIVGNALSKESVEWDKWHVFFCDERFVQLTDTDSNFNALKKSLFEKVPIPKSQIYAINSNVSIEEAAMEYAAKIRSVFGDVNLPRFDLLVLGMGPDGHICSLFPNHTLLDEKEKCTAFVIDSPKPPPQRITLTLPVINNAKVVCFTVMGGSKAEMVHRVIKNPLDKNIPASMVQASNGAVHWFLDKDAAKLVQ